MASTVILKWYPLRQNMEREQAIHKDFYHPAHYLFYRKTAPAEDRHYPKTAPAQDIFYPSAQDASAEDQQYP